MHLRIYESPGLNMIMFGKDFLFVVWYIVYNLVHGNEETQITVSTFMPPATHCLRRDNLWTPLNITDFYGESMRYEVTKAIIAR